MADKIQLLQLSPTMSEGTIVKWHVKEGDKLSAGDVIAEVETDKAVMEQEAFDDTHVLKLLVQEGDSVPVGNDILVVGEEGESADDVADSGSESKSESESSNGAAAKEEKEEKKTEKKEAAAASAKSSESSSSAPSAPSTSDGGRVKASPLAKKMAADSDLDLGQIPGSGPNGRVIKRDIERALEEGTGKAPAESGIPAPTLAKPQEGLYTEEINISGMRKTIARRLVESRQQVPSFSLNVEVDAEPVQNAVKRVRELYPDEKVTVTHFIIKAMANTLMKHEWLRSQWVGDKIFRMDAAHISVAVAVEDGLLTPVIKNVQSKGVVALSHELKELAGKARDRKLTEEDLTGGTQTLSNLGMFGIDSFDAIINPPESSILAVGKIIEKPVVKDGEITIGKSMIFNLSSDHRVVDGAVAASYLKDLKAALEEPLLMLV